MQKLLYFCKQNRRIFYAITIFIHYFSRNMHLRMQRKKEQGDDTMGRTYR